MAHLVQPAAPAFALAPRTLLARLAAFWLREDGLRHAAYISGALFVTLAAIKLATA